MDKKPDAILFHKPNKYSENLSSEYLKAFQFLKEGGYMDSAIYLFNTVKENNSKDFITGNIKTGEPAQNIVKIIQNTKYQSL